MDEYSQAVYAQQSVIGSILIDDRCMPLVLSKLREEDFTDSTCRSFFRAARELATEGRSIDPVTVLGKLKDNGEYVPWARQVMDMTPTAANVGEYISQVLEASMMYRFRALCESGMRCQDSTQAAELAQKIPLVFSATERMPCMTAEERATDFYQRMQSKDKPKYLPWGFPTIDRITYAELGDMILLGGYSSSGKTLLSILMATTQAKAGYKVGYYSLETGPKKMTNRQVSAMAHVPLEKIKSLDFTEGDWEKLAQAVCDISVTYPFTIHQAAGSSVDDITSDALGHGYQIIYVDYVQQLRVPGLRTDNPRIVVTEISQRLKRFAQSTGTAVVALAQLSRPETVLVDDKDKNGQKVKRKVIVAPSMHSFKESGQLEQDADLAFLLWAHDYGNNDSNRILKVGKNKEGFRQSVELVFHGDTQTMVELAPEPDHSVATRMSDIGRAAKQANRRNGQIQFQDVGAAAGDNPFEDP